MVGELLDPPVDLHGRGGEAGVAGHHIPGGLADLAVLFGRPRRRRSAPRPGFFECAHVQLPEKCQNPSFYGRKSKSEACPVGEGWECSGYQHLEKHTFVDGFDGVVCFQCKMPAKKRGAKSIIDVSTSISQYCINAVSVRIVQYEVSLWRVVSLWYHVVFCVSKMPK